MSFAAAVAHSPQIKCTLDRERGLAAVLLSEALSHGAPRAWCCWPSHEPSGARAPPR